MEQVKITPAAYLLAASLLPLRCSIVGDDISNGSDGA